MLDFFITLLADVVFFRIGRFVVIAVTFGSVRPKLNDKSQEFVSLLGALVFVALVAGIVFVMRSYF